jgi:hypothetical protein
MRLVLIVALVLLTGCRKSEELPGDNGSTIRQKGDSIEIRTKDGTARIDAEGHSARIETDQGTMTFGEGEVPEGFPLPIRPGASVEHSAHMTGPDGTDVFQLSYSAAGTAKELADFYETDFKERGLEITRSQQSGGGTEMFMVGGKSDEIDASAMVMHESGAGRPMVSLTWSTRKK